MKLLFRLAFQKRHKFLIALTVLSMCLLTVASQLEIFALGVITKKGPEFFQLFAPIKDGAIQSADSITLEQVQQRWPEISAGAITKADASAFLTQWKSSDFVERVVNVMNQHFGVSDNIRNLAIMIVIIALYKAVMLFMHRYSTRLVAIRVSRDLRQTYFEHIQSLPMEFYARYTSGSLSSRVVADAALIAEAVNACLTNYLQTPFTVLTTLTLCFLTSWKLSLLVFLGLPAIFFPILFLARRVRRVSRQIQQNQEKFSSVLIDFLAGIQTVKVFAMEDFSLKKYREHNERMALLEQKGARYDLSTRPIVHTIGMFFLALALMYGLYGLQMNVSEVLFYCGLLYVFYEPIKKFAEENSHIQRGISAAERMEEVLQMQPQIQDGPNAIDLTEFKESIEFKDVWFKYGENWVLRGLNFTVPKGQTVALVGSTGAGKSTIVQLLPRLYDVQRGEILIDGKPVSAYTQRSIREMIGFVPQRPFLFLDTAAANISFGRPFSMERIQDAARKAHADEFITKLPQGYETELSETGKNLSGGQQQRLAIARALVKQAPILVMDEATSSLDSVSEFHIKEALKQLHGQITQIVIAHRLSTIEYADKIVFLEHGQKIAEGTKDELLANCPPFRHMWEMMYRNHETTGEEAGAFVK